MTLVAIPVTNPSVNATVNDVPSSAASAFRTNINTMKAALVANIDAVQGALEQLQAAFGNGAVSGGTISAGTGLYVNVATLSAFVGNYLATTGSISVSIVAAGGADNSTNYLFLRQDGNFTANTTGSAPTDISTHGAYLLWGTVTTASGSVSAVTNVRRLWAQNLSYIYEVSADPANVQDGDVFYRTDTNEICVRSGGTIRRTAALT